MYIVHPNLLTLKYIYLCEKYIRNLFVCLSVSVCLFVCHKFHMYVCLSVTKTSLLFMSVCQSPNVSMAADILCLCKGSRKKSSSLNGWAINSYPLSSLMGVERLNVEKKVPKKVIFSLMARPLTPPPS